MRLSTRPLDPLHLDLFARMVAALDLEDPGLWPLTCARAHRQASRMLEAPDRVWPLFIEADGELAGYAILVPYWSNEFGGEIVWLDELYVAPERRGQGVGSAFLTHLRELCRERGWKRIELEVRAVNAEAARLYERHGFRTDGRHLYGLQVLEPEPGTLPIPAAG